MKTPFASRFAAIAATFVIAVSGSALAQHGPHRHGARFGASCCSGAYQTFPYFG